MFTRFSASSGAVSSGDFSRARDDRAARAVRVLDRNDSHRFWFRAATRPLRSGTTRLFCWQPSFHPGSHHFTRVFNQVSPRLTPLPRRIRTAVVELRLRAGNFRMAVQERLVI